MLFPTVNLEEEKNTNDVNIIVIPVPSPVIIIITLIIDALLGSDRGPRSELITVCVLSLYTFTTTL